MLIDFHWDTETRSKLDLKTSGPINYALHESTQVTLITWAFNRTVSVKAWRIGQPLPAELIHVFTNPHLFNIIAHNIQFDYLILAVVMPRQFPHINFIRPEVKNLTDNMALTCHFRLGASLESAAKMLGFAQTKDKEGRVIMLKQCKPGKNNIFPVELTALEWNKFEAYGIQDTKLMRDIYYMMPPMPEPERWAWEWTFKRNLKGITLDMNFLHELQDIVNTATPILEREFFEITGGFSVSSPIQCLKFFKHFYPEIENMQKETIEDLLTDDRYVPACVRRALAIKDLTGSTSLSKISTAINKSYNGKIFAFLMYHTAQTKRWSGKDLQVQNFARVDDKRPDKIDFSLDAHDIVPFIKAARPNLKDPLGYCKNLLRRMFIPSTGKYFYCGDWSKIEPTVLFWLLGQGSIPKKWYEETASVIYDMPVHLIGKDSLERQIGKMANLSCQYGSGPDSFKKAVKKQAGLIITDALAKRTVKAYRDKYRVICDFWRHLENAFKLAIKGQSSSLCEGKIFISPMILPFKGVQIRLPSGSVLYYHHARIIDSEYKNVLQENGTYEYTLIPSYVCYTSDEGNGRLEVKKIYGGLLCENVTSATARDVILPALYRQEEAGIEILNLVHDEMWGEAEFGRDEEFKNLMCINPSWCKDMKIEAETKSGVRYLK